MRGNPRLAAGLLFLLAGAALLYVGVFSGIFALDAGTGYAVAALGVGVAGLGALLLRRALSASREAAGPDSQDAAGRGAAIPLPHYTRNCPACGARMGLKVARCPACGRRVPGDGATCSAGERSADEAAAAFAATRQEALAARSPGYVWRAVRDERTCERCANNDGHTFLWDQEPIGGHAGARARCRCRPEPLPATGTAGGGRR